jgi:hypothetical protein
MDLDQRIAEAARSAITELGLSNVEYDAQYHHQDSERVEVHFREGTSYFGTQILIGGHPENPAKTDVETLTDQIVTKLRERDAHN